jgi:uncharacterized protein (DUF486 family)
MVCCAAADGRDINQLGIALAEYIFQVPANRLGYKENGGPFSLVELKVIQEVITLTVFTIYHGSILQK